MSLAGKVIRSEGGNCSPPTFAPASNSLHEPTNRRPPQTAWARRRRTTCQGCPKYRLRKGECGGFGGFGLLRGFPGFFLWLCQGPSKPTFLKRKGAPSLRRGAAGCSLVSERGECHENRLTELSTAPCDCLNERHPRGVGLRDGISQPHPPQENHHDARARFYLLTPWGLGGPHCKLQRGGGSGSPPPTPSLDRCL